MTAGRGRDPSYGTTLMPRQVLSSKSTVLIDATQTSPAMSISNFTGKVRCANSSGSAIAILPIVINNTLVQANSIILVSCERASLSAAGVEYLPNVEYNSIVAGVSFTVNIQRRAGTSIAASGAENVTVNYVILN